MLEGKDEKKQFYVTKNFCQNVSNTTLTLSVVKVMSNYSQNTAERGGYVGNSKEKEVSCKTEKSGVTVILNMFSQDVKSK